LIIDNGYNKFGQIPMMSYNILSYLIQNNEDIWKILKYPSSDCLSQPNLTQSEKGALIYSGEADSTPYRAFLDNFLDDAFVEQVSLLRIFPEIIIPTSRVLSSVTFHIQAFSHVKLQILDGYMNRNVYLMQQILQTLNGMDISGVGNLSFDRMGNPYDRANLNISNSKSFSGYSIFMSTRTA